MNRLREAREYLGLSLGDVGGYLGPAGWRLAYAEQGKYDLNEVAWARLAKLYRRPVLWLKGEPAPPVQITPELHDLMEGLSDHDRSEIVAFAEFLQHGRKVHG